MMYLYHVVLYGISWFCTVSCSVVLCISGFGENNMIIDFHSHILPGIDDGSRDLDTSMAMLEQIRAQQTDIMIATPHFCATQDRIDTFLQLRQQAYDALCKATAERGWTDYPQILTGSEVAFFNGISRSEEICRLTIEGTDLLLLEMPFVPWNEHIIEEVSGLIQNRHLRIMIAHLDRFIRMPGNKKYICQLLELPVYVQLNAECLTNWRYRHFFLKMLEEGTAHVLGSDCHGAHHRVPNLKAGRDMIQKKKGIQLLEKIDRQGYELLFDNGQTVPTKAAGYSEKKRRSNNV